MVRKIQGELAAINSLFCLVLLQRPKINQHSASVTVPRSYQSGTLSHSSEQSINKSREIEERRPQTNKKPV